LIALVWVASAAVAAAARLVRFVRLPAEALGPARLTAAGRLLGRRSVALAFRFLQTPVEMW
jgi:hypothetical protein